MEGPSKQFLTLLFLIFILCLCPSAITFANEENPDIYTLQSSIKEAIDNSRQIKIGEQKVEEAHYAEKKAGADFLA